MKLVPKKGTKATKSPNMTNEVPELALDILVNQVVHFSDCIILHDLNRYKNWEAFEVRFSCMLRGLLSISVFMSGGSDAC